MWNTIEWNGLVMIISRWRLTVPVIVAAFALGACNDPAPQVVIDGTGSLEGLLFFDASEDAIFDPSDGDFVLASVDVEVRNRGTEDMLATGTSGADGRFTIGGLPLGTHDLFVDTLDVPAGVIICQNPLRVSIFQDEPSYENINGRPGCLITIATAKDLGSNGDFVIIQGIVTSFPGQIESSITYIQDASAGTKIFANSLEGQGVLVGDRIEVGGTTGAFSGDFELENAVLRRIDPQINPNPTPLLVTTAAIAASGASFTDPLQGAFIRVEKAQLTVAFGAGGANIQNGFIDDGTGAVLVRVDDGVADRNQLNTIFTVGKCYDINGFGANFNQAGQIFPRSLADFVEVSCT